MEHDVVVRVAREHAVESDQMIVDVQVDARTTALNEVDGAALRGLDAVSLGARAVAREHALDEDAGDRGQHVGLERDELAKLVGQRQHVLPRRNVRDNAIDQECGCVRHAPARAARADAAAAAGEGDEQIVSTRFAREASETQTPC